MTQPIIGITLNYLPLEGHGLTHYLSDRYTAAVLRSGGLPILLPASLVQSKGLEQVLSALDGVLLTGGGDLAPDLFRGLPHTEIYDISPARDSFELSIVKTILQMKIPLLAICRGIQLLNVALGGSLFTHIKDQLQGALMHDQPDELPCDRLSHSLKVEQGSILSTILGKEMIEVNSLHHQGIHALGHGLTAVAFAPDGLVEAVEVNNHPFALGVQWHPEWLQAYAEQQKLFDAFSEATQNYHNQNIRR